MFNFPHHEYLELFRYEKQLLLRGWKYLGSGCQRRVLQRGNVVIKIPYTKLGLESNKKEYHIYKSSIERNYAPCRLLSNNCLLMRFVNPLSMEDPNLPSWAFELNDGPQVGEDKNGRIMAYDYAEC